MSALRFTILSIIFAVLACNVLPAGAAGTHLLKARVSDIDGRPVAGAKLFLYDSLNIRRPADFISPLSDPAGLVQQVLPPGKYWVIARYKSDGKYGPLLPGDRHSGEPLEIDLTAGPAEADFVVADIRELGQKKRAAATDAVRLRGRVVDAQGVPVAQALAFLNTTKDFNELPEYVSAWTGDDGRYELYVAPAPVYYIGASRQFPPDSGSAGTGMRVVERGKIDIAMDIDLTVK